MSKPKSQKKKMATIREVYDRILWDARLDRNAFTLGFIDRLSEGMREKPLAEWAADGDIPWHRIRYIRCGEALVWDRDRQVDRFSTGQLPTTAWIAGAKEEAHPNAVTSLGHNQSIVPAFEVRPIYQYGQQGWQPVDLPLESVRLKTLKIASLNVLCDRYESDRIQTAKRLPAIVEHLRQCEADILALQEVTPPLLDMLLAQDWVRSYAISEAPDRETLQPYGLLLLSRLPFTLVEHRYSAHKRVLVGTWQINERSLHVAVVHLTSDRAHNAVEVRSRQLSGLLAYLKTQLGDCIIVGDFNIKGDEQAEVLTRSRFVDIWQVLHPDQAGYTFDPKRNPLAALMSLSGRAARCDRILLLSEDGRWKPGSIELFACEPVPNTGGTIYPSDHFGLCARLECLGELKASLQTVRPIYQSAVVVIPPTEVFPAIQAIRRCYDRRFSRWMPHINLLYGFVPEEYFEEAAGAIASALTGVQPFEVTLSGFETFAHRSSCTAWLRPISQPPEALHQLQAILQQLFPQCDEQDKKSSVGYAPHLSVGQFRTISEAEATLPSWYPLKFRVESVALISRRGDESFQVRYLVRLGQQYVEQVLDKVFSAEHGDKATERDLMQLLGNLEPKLSQAQYSHHQMILSLVEQACAECLESQPSLHLLGSARLGVQDAQSDLDILCLIPPYVSGTMFLERVRQHLEALCDRAQVVEAAGIPVLRMRLEGVSVDLLHARSPSVTLELPTQRARESFDPVSWRALLGCLETDAIADAVCQYVPLELFRELLRAVRAWARARQIHGNAWGFLGSFSWALLAAWSCTRYPQEVAPTKLEALLAHFFDELSQQDWSQPVALTEAGKRYRVRVSRDWLPVITSIEPCQNSARNITRSTARLLQQEFARSAAIAEQVLTGKTSWATLFETANLQAQSDWFLVLTASSEDNDRLEVCCGWLESHAIGLVINLEQQLNVWVRPWTGIRRTQNRSCVVLGLELPKDCDRAAVEQLGKDFVLPFNAENADLGSNILESLLCDRQQLAQLIPDGFTQVSTTQST